MTYRAMLRKRLDANHKSIVEALKARGVLVQSLASIGGGCPDILAFYRGRLVLLEVKGAKGKLEPDQERMLALGWPIAVVRTPEEALAVVADDLHGHKTEVA